MVLPTYDSPTKWFVKKSDSQALARIAPPIYIFSSFVHEFLVWKMLNERNYPMNIRIMVGKSWVFLGTHQGLTCLFFSPLVPSCCYPLHFCGLRCKTFGRYIWNIPGTWPAYIVIPEVSFQKKADEISVSSTIFFGWDRRKRCEDVLWKPFWL